MASLLDDYMTPTDLPNFSVEPDPKELERMKYLGLMRFGLGVAGREPVGSAMSAGIDAISSAQTQARAEHRANMELLIKQHQAKQQYLDDVNKANWLKNTSVEELQGMGMPMAAINAIKYSTDPRKTFTEHKAFYEPFTLSAGGTRFDYRGNPIAQVPTSEGLMYGYSGGVPGMARAVPGAQEAQARQAALVQAGKQANTFGSLGKVGPNNTEMFGYPPLPPAVQPPPTTNFSGTAAQRAEAQGQYAGQNNPLARYIGAAPPAAAPAAPGAGPQFTAGGAQGYGGISPAEQATQTERGTGNVKAWEKVGEETAGAAGLAGAVKAKMGMMRDVLKQNVTPQGLAAPVFMAFQGLGASFGINTQGLPAAELFRSLTTQTALTVRNPQGDMGLPGSASNQDFTRLIDVSPNLSQSRRGQQLLVETYDAMSEMALKKAELWNNLNVQVQNGQMNEAQARREYVKTLTPYALEATAKIREAIAEATRMEAPAPKVKPNATQRYEQQRMQRRDELLRKKETD